MDTLGRKQTVHIYFVAAAITFLVAGFQIICYYIDAAKSISLFADTFHAGSDGITLLGTVFLLSTTVISRLMSEEKAHHWFTLTNIGFVFIGVGLALHELFEHAGEVLPMNWGVVIVAAIGGIGDFVVWRLLVKANKKDMPATLAINHDANILHIKQDMLQSWVVILSGIAIRFGIPYVDTVIGSVITLLIFWEGVGLCYEEITGKHFPLHMHVFGGKHAHHKDSCTHHHH